MENERILNVAIEWGFRLTLNLRACRNQIDVVVNNMVRRALPSCFIGHDARQFITEADGQNLFVLERRRLGPFNRVTTPYHIIGPVQVTFGSCYGRRGNGGTSGPLQERTVAYLTP